MSTNKDLSLSPKRLIRILGALLLFFGITLSITGSAVFVTLLSVSSIALIVLGFFLIVDSLKKAYRKSSTAKTTLLYCLLGILFLAIGILLSVFKAKSVEIFFIVVGAIVVVLGITILFSVIKKKKGKKTFGYYLFLAILTACCGICIILITVPSITGVIAVYYSFSIATSICGALLLISF